MLSSPITRRRWANFKANRRAYWSLILFGLLFGLSLFAEVLANDKPIHVQYRGEHFFPVYQFYPEVAFGGEPLSTGNEGFALRKGDADALNFFSNWILVNRSNGWLKERHDFWFKGKSAWSDMVALEQ